MPGDDFKTGTAAEGLHDANEDKDDEYQIEHRPNVFFQEQETQRKAKLCVRSFGISIEQ